MIGVRVVIIWYRLNNNVLMGARMVGGVLVLMQIQVLGKRNNSNQSNWVHFNNWT